MIALVVLVGSVLAVSAAVRSTWSPCGRSMLSTITPIGERGRGHRFAAAAGWFVAGGVLGGLCLGAVTAGVAAAVSALNPSATLTGALAASAVAAGAVLDAGLGGLRLPIHRRQVNERWLDRYRTWVYGLGFGWQIGSGLATYVMTAGVYLVILLGALSARPGVALALGCAFGTVRGLAVLLGCRIDTPARLAGFHRRFDALGEPSRLAMIGVELSGAAVLAGALWPPAVLAVAVPAAVGLLALRRRGRATAAA